MVVTNQPVTAWLTPVAGQPDTFRTTGVGPEVTLAPFYKTHRRIYTGYWDVLTPVENTARLEELEAERERIRRLEAATVVYLAPGDATVEKAHNQQGESTSIVRTRRPRWTPRGEVVLGRHPAERRHTKRDGHHLQPRQSARAQLRSAR